ncbi:MAG: hypothetical protein J0G95_14250 [Rhizobiales bacterium]|nr:hypothetical protein [Hyphomicrobiales bacterium]
MINLIQIRMVTAMSDPRYGDAPQMDHSTSLAVCNGIGERLRDIMKPGAGHLPPRLQELMDQLQHIEDAPSIVPQLD